MKEGEVVEVEHGRGGDQNHESRASSETVLRHRRSPWERLCPPAPKQKGQGLTLLSPTQNSASRMTQLTRTSFFHSIYLKEKANSSTPSYSELLTWTEPRGQSSSNASLTLKWRGPGPQVPWHTPTSNRCSPTPAKSKRSFWKNGSKETQGSGK